MHILHTNGGLIRCTAAAADKMRSRAHTTGSLPHIYYHTHFRCITMRLDSIKRTAHRTISSSLQPLGTCYDAPNAMQRKINRADWLLEFLCMSCETIALTSSHPSFDSLRFFTQNERAEHVSRHNLNKNTEEWSRNNVYRPARLNTNHWAANVQFEQIRNCRWIPYDWLTGQGVYCPREKPNRGIAWIGCEGKKLWVSHTVYFEVRLGQKTHTLNTQCSE